MKLPLIWTRNSGRAITQSDVGSKAFELTQLENYGYNVPDFVIIPQKSGEQLSAQITQWSDYQLALEAYFAGSIGQGKRFAVRSSAQAEDGSQWSFAGQYATCLNVAPADWQQAVREVLTSGKTVQNPYNQVDKKSRMSVIIQVMVNADVAGVAFGIHPVSGQRNTVVINAVWGLGEGLVSGQLPADTFIVQNNVVTPHITTKAKAYRTSNWGTKVCDVDTDRQNAPTLSSDQAMEIADIAKQLNNRYGRPQDVEFCLHDKELYVLQTRPVTQVHQLPDPNGFRRVWDNSNIIESYPGVTTPLTFSFIRPVYEAVYTDFGQFMGISAAEIKANRQVFAQMLGLLNGQVYYNLESWYKALALLPGFTLNARYMETMMGVKERFDISDLPKRSQRQARWQLAGMVLPMIGNLVSLPRKRKEFMLYLRQTLATFAARDWSTRSTQQLMQDFLGLEALLIERWKAPLTNDFFTMIFFGMLKKQTDKLTSGLHPNLHNDLHCGSGDIISTQPIKRLLDLAQTIQGNDALKSLFTHNTPAQIMQELGKGEQPGFQRQVQEYIDEFGERCVGELKLESISYKQDHEKLVQLLQSYVEYNVQLHKNHDIEYTIRQQAEQILHQALANKPFRRVWINWLLHQSRILVSARENLRFERTRVFGVVRTIFSAMGQQFYYNGLLDNPRDIFYLTKDEIFAYVSGASVQTRLRDLIALRKDEYAGYQGLAKPSARIETRGMVYLGNNFFPQVPLPTTQSILAGVGCCPGRVKAQVQVVQSPNEVGSMQGRILVASSTDPGWVVLFPSAAGILVERGSLLSHSAIVSRELGIPCIVGITGLLDMLESGDWVEMDGAAGTIHKLNE